MLIVKLLYQPGLSLGLGIIFLALNVLDAHSTWCVLRPNHYERERNPIARWILRKLGLVRGIMIFKGCLVLILATSIGFYVAYDPLTINIVLIVAILLFAWVVWHNYRIVARLGGKTRIGIN